MMIRTRFTVTDEVEIDGELDLVQEFLNLVQDTDGAVYWQLTDTLGREVGRTPVDIGGIATTIGEHNEPLPPLDLSHFEVTSGRLKGNVSNVPRSPERSPLEPVDVFVVQTDEAGSLHRLTPEEVEAGLDPDLRRRWLAVLERYKELGLDPRPPYAGYRPGGYMSRCSTCKEQVGGVDKHCWTCPDCAYGAPLDPDYTPLTS